MIQTISTVENLLKTVSINPGDKILAAVSGGADSVAMLHLLSQSTIYNLQSTIICAHINHHLRGNESDEDQAFMETLCADWNIPLFIEQIDVKASAAKEKLSIETAARHLRLEALERIAQKTGCRYIATAHHKDDQAETVLFRLMRGTAFAGLTGIRPSREHNGLQWIRPMLNIRRTEIESYCRQNNIAWRTDASNIEIHYRRNWIRHRLLPHLQQESKTDLAEKLAALAQSALKFHQHNELAANKIFESKIEDRKSKINLSAAAIQQAGPFVVGEILRIVLHRLNCGLRDITLSHYHNFFQLLDKTSDTLQLPGGCTIRKKNDTLVFEVNASSCKVCPDFVGTAHAKSADLAIPGTIQFANWHVQTKMIQITPSNFVTYQKHPDNLRQWFDCRQIQFPLVARLRRDEDSFTPFGRKTQKRINRFLTDSQIDEKQRESCFVIEDKGGILWLAPIRRSALAPVTNDTVNILEIRIDPV
jgi:tRNA(Ile)-lysidine synthase